MIPGLEFLQPLLYVNAGSTYPGFLKGINQCIFLCF